MAIPSDVVTGQLITAADMNAILATLRDMEASRECGSVVITLSNESNGTGAVTFTKTFASVPKVTATVNGNSVMFATTFSKTETGFSIAVRHYDNSLTTASVTVDWQAEVAI